MSDAVVRRPLAETDLVHLWSYIASDNEAAADRFLAKVEGVLDMLGRHPQAGRLRPELYPDLRSFPVGNYVVFYLAAANGIEVVRVLSSYLDIDQSSLAG